MDVHPPISVTSIACHTHLVSMKKSSGMTQPGCHKVQMMRAFLARDKYSGSSKLQPSRFCLMLAQVADPQRGQPSSHLCNPC